MRTAFNTQLSDIPEDILREAKAVEKETKLRSFGMGETNTAFYIALAIWNERER